MLKEINAWLVDNSYLKIQYKDGQDGQKGFKEFYDKSPKKALFTNAVLSVLSIPGAICGILLLPFSLIKKAVTYASGFDNPNFLLLVFKGFLTSLVTPFVSIVALGSAGILGISEAAVAAYSFFKGKGGGEGPAAGGSQPSKGPRVAVALVNTHDGRGGEKYVEVRGNGNPTSEPIQTDDVTGRLYVIPGSTVSPNGATEVNGKKTTDLVVL